MSTAAIEPRRLPHRPMVAPAGVALIVAAALAGWWAAGLDGPVHRWLVGHRSPATTSVMKAITQVGSPVAMVGLAVVVTIVLWLRTRQPLVAAVPLVAAAAATVAEVSLKQLVGRSRPPVVQRLVAEDGYSFPSGHATVSASLLTAVALLAPQLVPKAWVLVVRVAAVVGIVLIGGSRLYLGVHWPVDVLAGWVLGAAVGVATLVLSRRLAARPGPDRP